MALSCARCALAGRTGSRAAARVTRLVTANRAAAGARIMPVESPFAPFRHELSTRATHGNSRLFYVRCRHLITSVEARRLVPEDRMTRMNPLPEDLDSL